MGHKEYLERGRVSGSRSPTAPACGMDLGRVRAGRAPREGPGQWLAFAHRAGLGRNLGRFPLVTRQSELAAHCHKFQRSETFACS